MLRSTAFLAAIAAFASPALLSAQPESFTPLAAPDAAAPQVAEASGNGAALLREAGRHLSRIAADVNPAVVHIESVRQNRNEVIEETGSGVIMQSPKIPNLFVVTNRHVVAGAALHEVDVKLSDGRVLHPIRVMDDFATDLAVLVLRETDCCSAKWGDSDNLDIGHVVLALGSPFGLSQSVTMGIISAKGRRSLSLGGPREVINQDFLQTDAAINPGNSGGPLVDLQGHVVGINTAIASQGGGNEGIGFSIPSSLVRFVVDQLLDHGRVHRGYLGVKLDNTFDATAASLLKLPKLCGARVLHVYRDTPAYLAGLRIDDVVLNFDGIDVQDESHLIHRVSLTPVNKTVRVVVMRDGQEVTLKVTLMERPADPRAEQPAGRTPVRVSPSGYRHVRTGLRVHRIENGLALQLGLGAGQQGVLVMTAPQTTSQDDDGLRLYDVIEEVARQRVSTVDDFHRIVSTQAPDAPLLLKVRRVVDGETVTRLAIWRR